MCDDTPFNKLTPAEAERLDLLQEECAEVIQAVAKIKRHGYDSHHPTNPNPPSNRQSLERELGDLYWVILLMISRKDIDKTIISYNADFKDESVWPYLHHQ